MILITLSTFLFGNEYHVAQLSAILFCQVAWAKLKGCHQRIYYFGNHFQKQ